MTKGNGKFNWWAAAFEDSERWHGPHASRQEAVDAFTVIAREDGHDHFYVGEADQSVCEPLFDADRAAESLIEEIGENNIECWDEDGWSDTWSSDEQKALAAALKRAVANWMKKHPAGGNTLNDFRVFDRIETATGRTVPASEPQS